MGDLAAFLGLRDLLCRSICRCCGVTVSVRARRDGQTIWYSIASLPARRVLETLFEIFCKPASLCEPPARQQTSKASARAPSRKQR